MAARRADRRLTDREPADRPRPSPSRGHTLLPHTADVALEAHGPDPTAAFEEAALALAEVTADLPGAPGPADPSEAVPVELAGRDLVALAFAWLNELVGRIDVDGALVGVTVERVEPTEAGWRLQAIVSTEPFDDDRVRRRADVKSATYHGLAVEPSRAGWTMTAVLDV